MNNTEQEQQTPATDAEQQAFGDHLVRTLVGQRITAFGSDMNGDLLIETEVGTISIGVEDGQLVIYEVTQ